MYDSLIIMAKHFIHRCRFGNARPLFIIFMNELTNFKKALKSIKAKQALDVHRSIHILFSD